MPNVIFVAVVIVAVVVIILAVESPHRPVFTSCIYTSKRLLVAGHMSHTLAPDRAAPRRSAASASSRAHARLTSPIKLLIAFDWVDVYCLLHVIVENGFVRPLPSHGPSL